MIAGQAEDLAATDRDPRLRHPGVHPQPQDGRALHRLGGGGGGGGARVARRSATAVATYAKNLGLAFQIVDDLIDATGHAAAAGRTCGQDVKKTTFVSFAGVEGARQLADELVADQRGRLARLRPPRPAAARPRALRRRPGPLKASRAQSALVKMHSVRAFSAA